jgi:dTDP-4-dehydrorhamnose 3,5-epimerase
LRGERLRLPEVILLHPRVFADGRGWFYESFNEAAFVHATGCDVRFVQDNHSRSAKGVLRGLHFQLPPHAQGKLVRVVRGAVYDVAVDVRRSSPTFGQWVAAELSEDNRCQLWIPAGFAHGFLALTDGAEVLYKTTDRWEASAERSIAWNDPGIGVEWPLQEEPRLSPKDAAAPFLPEVTVFD